MDDPKPAPQPAPQAHPKRTKILIRITLCILVIGGCVGFYHWKWGRFEQYTDDAYVSGNLIYVTPQTEGIVTKIYADDTRLVEKGQILVELDQLDFIVDLEKKRAELGDAIRKAASLFAQTREKKAKVRVAKAEFVKDAQDFERRSILIQSGSVSNENLTHAEAALTSSYFSLIAAEQSYLSSLAEVENTTVETHPTVLEAAQNLREARIRLNRSVIKAPATGLVAQRKAQIGERVNPAEPIMAVVPLDQIWIDANFKEDQIGKMEIGQKAIVKTDIYGGGVVYEGEVIGMGAGTGSVFSLLPPQNATGNWIKIVQRVPIRIGLDPDQIALHPLRIGLSGKVTVDIHALEEISPPKVVSSTPLYETFVFAEDEEGAESDIREAFAKNLPRFSVDFEEGSDL